MVAERGRGERAERSRRRRVLAATAIVFACGLLVGASVAFGEGDRPWDRGATIAAPLALALAGLAILAVAFGSWRYHRETDELFLVNGRHAAATGASALLGGYPLWLILWKGGLVREPDHFILYAAVFLVSVATFAWRSRA